MSELANVFGLEMNPDSPMCEPLCGKPAPIRNNGTVTCSNGKCAAENPIGLDSCERCGAFLLQNQKRRTNGTFAKFQPRDVVERADDMYSAVVSDLGGAESMTAMQRALAAKLRDTDLLLQLNARTILTEGVENPAGRRAHDRYLSALDRFVRLASLLGLERRTKQVDPMLAIRQAVAEANK